MKPPRTNLTRRAVLLGATAGIGALAGRQCLLPTNDPGPAFPDPGVDAGPGVLNDAGELSPTPVASHLTIGEDPRAGAVERPR